MLALALTGHPWSLCCLWFEIPGSVADQHRRELNEFASQIGPDAERFSALTYQELFSRMMLSVGPEHAEYLGYLKSRYLTGSDVT